jgi:hypothetical protein
MNQPKDSPVFWGEFTTAILNNMTTRGEAQGWLLEEDEEEFSMK